MPPSPIVAVDRESVETPPEQDVKVQHSILFGPKKANQVRLPIVKSKVETVDDVQDDGNYVVVKSNNTQLSGILKPKQNIPDVQKSRPIAPANGNTAKPLSSSTGRVIAGGRAVPPVESKVKLSKLPSAVPGPPKRTKAADRNMKPAERVIRRSVSPNEVQKKPSDKGKKYDPAHIKSYMEQQREVRRLQKKHDREQKIREAERKKQQLLELENKTKDLITRSRFTPKPADSKDDQHLSLATKNYRARKAKSPTATQQPPQMKSTISTLSSHSRKGSKKPPDPNDMSAAHFTQNEDLIADRRADAEAELRTSFLLQEFESIVQREVNVLKIKGSENKVGGSSTTLIKSDKAIETTLSLLQDPKAPSECKLSSTRKIRTGENLTTNSCVRDVRGDVDDKKRRAEAATKIQAAFRAWRTRKYLSEIRSEHQEFQRPGPTRRISFYRARTPEVRTRRMPLIFPSNSPVHSLTNLHPLNNRHSNQEQQSAFGVTLDSAPYIPPPSTTFFSPTTMAAGRRLSASTENIPPVPLYPVAVAGLKDRRKSNRFEEPFPKEAVMRLNSPRQPVTPVNSDPHLRRDLTSPIVNMVQIPGISDLLSPCIPTFSMVLQEKVKILMEKQQAAAERRSETAVHQRTPVKQSHLPDSYYDSDSTQHASIILSSDVKRTSSSTDVTITDDYIGPDHEAMQLAYNLRKSPRLSLEADVSYPSSHGQKVDVEMGKDFTIQSSSLYSTTDNSTGVTETEEEPSYCEPDHRPRRDPNSNKQPSMSLTNFKLRVEENKNAVLEKAVHAYASLDEMRKSERQEQQRQFGQNHNLEAEVGHLRKEVSAINETLRTNFLRTSEPSAQATHHDHLVQLAKTQAESLKATVEVQQWLMELNSTSAVEVRRQDAANLEAVISAAVEIAKVQQVQPQQQPRLILQGQSVQTTGSLLQNLDSYSADGFFETSLEDFHIEEEELEAIEKLTADEFLASEVSDLNLISKSSREKPGAVASVTEPSNYSKEAEKSLIIDPPAVQLSSSAEAVKTEETNSVVLVQTREKDDSLAHPSAPECSSLQEIEEEPTCCPSLSSSVPDTVESPVESVPVKDSESVEKDAVLQRSKDELMQGLPINLTPELTSESPSLKSLAEESHSKSKDRSFEFEEKQKSAANDSVSSEVSSEASDFIPESSMSKSIAEDLDSVDRSKKIVEPEGEVADVVSVSSPNDVETTHDAEERKAEDGKSMEHSALGSSLLQVIEEEATLASKILQRSLEEESKDAADDSFSEVSDFISESSSVKPPAEDSRPANPEPLASESAVASETETATATPVSTGTEADVTPASSDTGKAVQLQLDDTKKEDSSLTSPVPENSRLEKELEEAALDMIELHEYNKSKVGVPAQFLKPVKKWCVRRRDIADEVLVAELVEENREWTDHRAEEAIVKEALVDVVMRRAVRETLQSISQIIGK